MAREGKGKIFEIGPAEQKDKTHAVYLPKKIIDDSLYKFQAKEKVNVTLSTDGKTLKITKLDK